MGLPRTQAMVAHQVITFHQKIKSKYISVSWSDLFFLDTEHSDILCHFYYTENYYLVCIVITLLLSVNPNYQLQYTKITSILQVLIS